MLQKIGSQLCAKAPPEQLLHLYVMQRKTTSTLGEHHRDKPANRVTAFLTLKLLVFMPQTQNFCQGLGVMEEAMGKKSTFDLKLGFKLVGA